MQFQPKPMIIAAFAAGLLSIGLITAGVAASDPPAAATSEMKHDMAPAMTGKMNHDEMERMIAEATTSHDHEMIARHYDTAAQRLDTEASGHERLARTYAAFGSGKSSGQSLAQHCRILAKSLHAAARENRDLAALHREMGKAAP